MNEARIRIHELAFSSPTVIVMGNAAFGAYIHAAGWVSRGDDLRLPRELFRYVASNGRQRSHVRDCLVHARVITVEDDEWVLCEQGDGPTGWLYLGPPGHPYPLVSIRPPGWRAVARMGIPGWKRDLIVERDEMVCGLCSLPVADRAELHIDHVIPVALGGSDEIDNLQVAHASCNLAKGARC